MGAQQLEAARPVTREGVVARLREEAHRLELWQYWLLVAKVEDSIGAEELGEALAQLEVYLEEA